MPERQTGPILVVDDEPALLRLFQQYLNRLGYEVDACSGASRALELFSRNPFKYALVLADLTMPGMSGHELLEQLLALNPEVRVLLCSGYPFDLRGLPIRAQGQIRFLQKPFLPRMLFQALEELFQHDTKPPQKL